MKRILTTLFAGILLSATAAHAGPSSSNIELASLETGKANVGWLQVLSEEGKPAKKVTAKSGSKRNINRSPVGRELVSVDASIASGTIIVDNSERRLYHVIGKGIAMKYGVSVGRDGFIWTGTNTVSRKAEWPTWTPPEDMRAREAKKGKILPASMEGGIDNPLGARAMYLGSTIYRIHGTNQPASIGQAMSSGCIRMANEDVEHLYAAVTIGTKVIVRN
ncbi:L,D-transpeptidase [Pararhizobium sp.]|uniref:L,D-transpeptidase n=1 Tax=Pararhizobium sp. TaxID=1977563 RepID=UPI00271FB2C2|nr:L,D-transpeptidase [Pararhizobium sp.]MDO9418958.1 L,D-transpeptidase [Pararhizobium sp.]